MADVSQNTTGGDASDGQRGALLVNQDSSLRNSGALTTAAVFKTPPPINHNAAAHTDTSGKEGGEVVWACKNCGVQNASLKGYMGVNRESRKEMTQRTSKLAIATLGLFLLSSNAKFNHHCSNCGTLLGFK